MIVMKRSMVHLVWHYPIVCQTPKEDFFKICKDAGGGEIVSAKEMGFFETIRKIWRREVHAQGRGFPFPEAACLFARKSIYSPHNDTLGSRWYTRAVRRFLFNRYDKIVSETDYGRQMLIRQGVRKEKVVALPIPVDYSFFSKPSGGASFRKKHKLGKEPFALVVGIRPVKNPHVILEACRIAGIKAVLVGPCRRDETKRVWKGRGFDWYLPDKCLLNHKNAVFVGQLSAKELLAAMDAATIFINSSTYESFGLAAYEAAAAGLPLCLPGLGAFDNFHGCALFHKPKDADGLAANIRRYLADVGLRKRSGSKAKSVARRLDYHIVRKMYEKFYEDFS